MSSRFPDLALVFILLRLAPPQLSHAEGAKAGPPVLKVGSVAPEFTPGYFEGKDLKKFFLHDLRGKKNVIVSTAFIGRKTKPRTE